MAMSLLLRNAGKLNGGGFLKTTRLTPLKTYTTVVAAQHNVLAQAPKTLVKNVLPLSRNISLSTPKLAAAGGNYTNMWKAERAVSLILLGVLPAAFIYPSQALDALMAVSVVLHTHWGIEAVITDYLRPAVVGAALPKIAHLGLILLSVVSLGGLFYLVYNDVGIAQTIKKLWAVKGYEQKKES